MSNLASTSPIALPVKTFRVNDLSVYLHQSEAQMALSAAQLIHTYLQNLLSQQSTASIILATGNSQIKFLEALIDLGGIDWSLITLFHLDEYLGIDANHNASFRRYLHERVEKRVQPAVFHYLEGDTLQPLSECKRYAQLLSAQPIDLCCLGLGENGHLAFNEPSVADVHDPYQVKLVKLESTTRQQQVDEGHFPDLEAVPQYGFTLTVSMICSANKILCLAPEKRKAKVVQKMLQEPISTSCPASILRTQAQATLFLDTDSASLL